MEGIDNSIAARAGTEELLHQMEQVAAALVTGPSISDFRVHPGFTPACLQLPIRE
jgi:hypothetical protein